MLARTAALTALTALAIAAAPAAADPPSVSSFAGDSTAIRLVSTSLVIKERRQVAVKVRCTTAKACKGVLRLRVGNGSDRHRKRYSVAGRKTSTISVGITPTAKRKADEDGAQALVTLTEADGDVLERIMPIRIAASVDFPN